MECPVGRNTQSRFTEQVTVACESLPQVPTGWVPWGEQSAGTPPKFVPSLFMGWPLPDSPAKRSNQSLLKEINPEYSLEGLMLKLKLQYFGHLMRTADSLEKTLMLGKVEGRRRGNRGWDGWMASPTQWTEFEQAPGDGEGEESLACCSPWGCKELDTTEWLNWTELLSALLIFIYYIIIGQQKMIEFYIIKTII